MSHRELVCNLYNHIEEQSQSIKQFKNLIKELRDELLKNSIELPKLYNTVNTII